MARVVTEREGTSSRQVGGRVHRNTGRLFQGLCWCWWWWNYASVGGVVALDYPGAVGLGDAPLLHRRPLGEGQRTPGALQSRAFEDSGKTGATQAAERRPAAHG